MFDSVATQDTWVILHVRSHLSRIAGVLMEDNDDDWLVSLEVRSNAPPPSTSLPITVSFPRSEILMIQLVTEEEATIFDSWLVLHNLANAALHPEGGTE